ncbi:hypothetical protein MSAN_01076700 [Mycena sanguinolenta]|uniref:ABM domain-containing protein n=1 Tax=Mycena sanguinolenta TaxID=230812 RepID=A0A8H6YT68_9AGAR|nr:hypothetical protein MSAN_01076700 [Mycena sanguinolenta]
MSVVQRIAFTASNKFADPNVFGTALEIVKSKPGFLSSFHGLQIDDGKTGYFITVWQSTEHYFSFAQGSAYSDFLTALKPAAADELEIHHVHTGSVDVTTALTAPTTELVLWTLKAGVTIEEITPLFIELGRSLDIAKGAYPPSVWAPSKDSDKHILVFVGWDSVEAHMEAVKEGTEAHAVIGLFAPKADYLLGHAHFVK